MTTTQIWEWERRRGPADLLHAPEPPAEARRGVWEMLVDGPAIVLGSSQPAGDIDEAAACSSGVAVARRRSGGGAVLLVPGDHLWIDVWLPAGDSLWDDDIGRAAGWLADVWVTALDSLGFDDLVAHRGPMFSNEWSGRVCFAGLGPGEVTAGGRKIVGISQRRTRDWARFQCLAHRRWDASTTFGLLSSVDAPDAAEAWRDEVVAVGDARVGQAFAAVLDAS